MDIHISFITYRSCKKNKEGAVGVIMILWKKSSKQRVSWEGSYGGVVKSWM